MMRMWQPEREPQLISAISAATAARTLPPSVAMVLVEARDAQLIVPTLFVADLAFAEGVLDAILKIKQPSPQLIAKLAEDAAIKDNSLPPSGRGGDWSRSPEQAAPPYTQRSRSGQQQQQQHHHHHHQQTPKQQPRKSRVDTTLLPTSASSSPPASPSAALAAPVMKEELEFMCIAMQCIAQAQVRDATASLGMSTIGADQARQRAAGKCFREVVSQLALN
jgi:hypothetical protein